MSQNENKLADITQTWRTQIQNFKKLKKKKEKKKTPSEWILYHTGLSVQREGRS